MLQKQFYPKLWMDFLFITTQREAGKKKSALFPFLLYYQIK